MKISIITVTYNCEETIETTILSVLNQTYENIEYILIDGSSKDNTINIINKYHNKINKFISEPDCGIYDALNKGIKLASGEFISILHSGDIFVSENTINNLVDKIKKFKDTDIFYSNIFFINNLVLKNKVRFYSSKYFNKYLFRFGFMPAHTSTIIRTTLFEKYGYYNINYEIAGDFDLLLKYILVNKINCKYLELNYVMMLIGGKSTKNINSAIKLNKEILLSLRSNKIYSNYIFIYSKYLVKIPSYLLNKLSFLLK
jgi:glycosyltransferase involved in cell wall biosynthesis